MTVAGEFYPLPKQERRISVIGSGLLPTPIVLNGGQTARSGDRKDETPTLHAWAAKGLPSAWEWPTPTVNGNNNRAGLSPTSGDGLSTAVKRWPTPRAEERGQHNSRDNGVSLSKAVSNQTIGGALNPDWVDLLMGWPRGWTSLDTLPAESWSRWRAGDWWGDGWENDTPRITNDRRKRIARLRLLGNGQVPQTAAAAWRLLVGGAQ